MEFTIKTGSPAKLKTGLLVLGAFAGGKLPALTDGVEIVPAGLGEKVGDYAALALVLG